MARGKFNKRSGGPRLDAENVEEIEIRNNKLAELEDERQARRDAENDSDEDDDENGENGDKKKKAEKKASTSTAAASGGYLAPGRNRRFSFE